MTIHRIMAIALLMLLSIGAAPPIRPDRRAPASQPSDPLTDAAIRSATDGTLAGFSSQVEQEILPLLADIDEKALPRLTRLAALREFGRYFSRLPKNELSATDLRTLQWLPTQPNLLNSLMMAVGNTDAPDKVLAILTALRLERPELLDPFSDLAAAICVVWDEPQRKRNEPEPEKLDVARPRLLFRYYTNTGGMLQVNPRILPWQLATFLVDNVVSEDEIAWALQRYAKRGAIGAVYFDVPYDYNTYFGTGANVAQARGNLYTLQNLTTMGGICADQAYFATQVSRSVGVPAAIAAGRGGSGDAAHAWVGYLDLRASRPSWNWEQGRYPEFQFFKGRVIDPQTREGLTEADVSLSGELMSTTSAARNGAAALAKLSGMVPESSRAELLMKAIDFAPGHRDSWLLLADMGARRQLTEPQLRAFKSVVAKFATRAYPDFAMAILVHAVSGRGTAEQLKELDSMRTLFAGTRPDIQAELSSARAELLKRENRPGEALAAYGDVLSRYGSIGPIAMETLERVDELLRNAGEMKRLSEIYRHVWSRMAQPESSAYIQTTPYYIIGSRYEALLKETGDTAAAAQARSRLDSLTAASTSSTSGRRR